MRAARLYAILAAFCATCASAFAAPVEGGRVMMLGARFAMWGGKSPSGYITPTGSFVLTREQTNNGSYVLTDYYPNYNSKIEVCIKFNTPFQNVGKIFGMQSSNTTKSAIFLGQSNNTSYPEGVFAAPAQNWSYIKQTKNVGTSDFHVISISKDGVIVDGTMYSYSYAPSQTSISNLRIALFTCNRNGVASNCSNISMKYAKFYEGDVVVRDYCATIENGVAGLKDRVYGSFYGSSNSYPFVYTSI